VHTSNPSALVVATKYQRPATVTLVVPSELPLKKKDEPGPGLRSASSAVPAGVPSVFHTSAPCTPSSAKKSRLVPTTPIGGRLNCAPLAEPGLMSAIIVVPAA